MPSLFEYLKRRTYESIVAGVQEALTALDRPTQQQSTGARPENPAVPAPTPKPDATEFDPQKLLPGAAPPSNENPPLPPPRRRGRPRREDRQS